MLFFTLIFTNFLYIYFSKPLEDQAEVPPTVEEPQEQEEQEDQFSRYWLLVTALILYYCKFMYIFQQKTLGNSILFNLVV